MKVQNQTTAILAGMNKFNRKLQNLWFNEKYLNDILLFQKLLVAITSRQND